MGPSPERMHLAAGGAYIYRLGERRWCLGPELHGEAEQKFAEVLP